MVCEDETMKKIVLKPKISLKKEETYLIDDEECIFIGNGDHAGQLEFRGKKTGGFFIWDFNIIKIIESPYEPTIKENLPVDHFSEAKKMIDKPVCLNSLEDKSRHTFESFCKKCDGQYCECNCGMFSKCIYCSEENKSSLKIRVGGIYIDGYGRISKLERTTEKEEEYPNDKFDCATWPFKAKRKDQGYRYYTSTGKLGFGASKSDLIEEVQLDQENQTKEQIDRTVKIVNETYAKIASAELKFSVDEDQTVAEKEYCECDLSGSSIWLLSYHIKSNKYFCGKCTKEFVYPGSHSPKPEGNPFKVGEKVQGFYIIELSWHPQIFTGEVIQIHGDVLMVRDSQINPLIKLFHYKQCERV